MYVYFDTDIASVLLLSNYAKNNLAHTVKVFRFNELILFSIQSVVSKYLCNLVLREY